MYNIGIDPGITIKGIQSFAIMAYITNNVEIETSVAVI